MQLSDTEIRRVVRLALEEDIGAGDATTEATVPSNAIASAWMVAREPIVVAGLAVAECAFQTVSASVAISSRVSDGAHVPEGSRLMEVSGSASAILQAERVALNFLQRLSGIATFTAQYVAAIKGTKAQILDTRKTTPGLRRLEKYAVTCGGGRNHRMGLFDMVLIKDNHLSALKDSNPNPVAAAVSRARDKFPKLRVEVEADSLGQVRHALEAGADVVLLDNMSLAQMREAVSLIAGRAQTEASGGVNLSTVRAIAETGVDFISVGALTHSARAVDIGLDFV